MSEDAVVQIIISFIGLLGTLVGVIVILNKRLSSSSSNGKNVFNGIQRQIDAGTTGTKTLVERFDDQVGNCNQRWLENAEFKGEVRGYMVEIREKLKHIEEKPP